MLKYNECGESERGRTAGCLETVADQEVQKIPSTGAGECIATEHFIAKT